MNNFLSSLLKYPLTKLARAFGVDLIFMLRVHIPYLNAVGRRDEALRLLLADAGLAPEDLDDPARLRELLGARLAGESADTTALYAATLAGLLGAEGARERGLRLIAADLGLSPEEYRDPRAAAEGLRRRLQALTPDGAVTYMQMAASTLAMAERHAEALTLLEADFGLDADDYGEGADARERLSAKLAARLEGVTPDLALAYVVTLWSSYGVVGRDSEGLAVMEADLGLRTEEFSDGARLDERLTQRLSSVQSVAACAYLIALSMNLLAAGRDADGIRVLETNVQLTPGDYEDAGVLRSKLRTSFEGMPGEMPANYVTMLAGALQMNGRPKDALALMETDLGIEAGDYADPVRLTARVRSHLNLTPEVTTTYMRPLVGALREFGRVSEVVAVLEAVAGLAGVDYANLAELAARLRTHLETVTEGTGGGYILELMWALREAGRHEQAAHLLDCYMQEFARLGERTESRHSSLIQIVPLTQYWLEYWGGADEARALEVCGQIVPYLRRALAGTGVTLQDRQSFISYVESLRRTVIEVGLHWAARGDEAGGDRDRLRILVQIWDAELTQRALLERFQLGVLDARVAPAEPPRNAWPCEAPAPSSPGHLPAPEDLAREFQPSLGGANLAFLGEGPGAAAPLREAEGSKPGEARGGDIKHAYPELFQRAQAIVGAGVSEELLATLLGADAVLLRATFDSRRRLLWTALRADGARKLSVAATSASADGSLDRLRWATARHDFRLLLTWTDLKIRNTEPGLYIDVRAALTETLERLRRLKSAREGGATWDAAAEQWPFDWLESERGRLGLGTASELVGTWQRALGDPPGDAEAFDRWLAEALRQTELLLVTFNTKVTDADERRRSLDAITREYVEEVAAVFDLEALAAALTPETHLILQVDDALHAAPLAHLPLAGRPLYQRVRSVRTSFSVLFTALQQEAEAQFHAADSARMLAVSWFAPGEDETNRRAVRWLHHGHSVLAKEYGLECLAAADHPPGSIGSISAALGESRALRLMTVCGHGHHEEAGVKLMDDVLWGGGGWDLSQVEWLLMVSCSIGRLAQTGDRDVSGFCVNLALHRVLSALACRWPVNTLEACLFANEVVHQFLKLGCEPGRRDNLRSEALNEARKLFLGEGEARAPLAYAGLNTVAAFELYGLG